MGGQGDETEAGGKEDDEGKRSRTGGGRRGDIGADYLRPALRGEKWTLLFELRSEGVARWCMDREGLIMAMICLKTRSRLQPAHRSPPGHFVLVD